MVAQEVGVYVRVSKPGEIQCASSRLSALDFERDGVQARPLELSTEGPAKTFAIRTRLKPGELCELLAQRKIMEFIGLDWAPCSAP